MNAPAAHPLLSAYVTSPYRYENATDSAHDLTTLPDGRFDLIIFMQQQAVTQCRLYGLWTTELSVQVPACTVVYGVGFKPLAAEILFGRSIAPLLNAWQAIDPNSWQLEQLSGNSPADFGQLLIAQCLSRIQFSPPPDSRKLALFNLLEQSAGSLAVQEIADRVNWSSRQLNRYMNHQLGLSLKAYTSILRCQAAYADIRKGVLFPQQPFFDQSHFIRDIKRITGATPGQLRQNKDDRFLQFRP